MADDQTPYGEKRAALDRVAVEIAEYLSGVLKRHGVPSGDGDSGVCLVFGWGDLTCTIYHGLPLEAARQILDETIAGGDEPEAVAIAVPKVNRCSPKHSSSPASSAFSWCSPASPS